MRAISQVRRLRPAGRPGRRAVRGAVLSGAALVLLWLALALPDRPGDLGAAAVLRVPVEALLLGLVAVLLPRPGSRWGGGRRWVLGTLGALAGLLAVLKVLDLVSLQALSRPFDPLTDLGHLGSAIGVLSDSVGRPLAVVAVVAAGALVCLLLVGVPLATLRVGSLAATHRRQALALLGGLAVLAAGQGVVGVPSGAPVVAAADLRAAAAHAAQLQHAVRDRGTFAREIGADRYAATPPGHLLQALRGHDVVLAFVESYGRVAVDPRTPQGAQVSRIVTPVLDDGTRRLAAAGWTARSAFLTSSTFGGLSWLAHSTLQSGLQVSSQERYDQLLDARRLTLTGAFQRAGWRTVSMVPANTKPWPQGRRFYGFEAEYGAHDLGYRGPQFGYARVPDQFTLAALDRLELGSGTRRPVMAEVDLESSHTPWAPLPRTVPAASLGDGSVYDPMPAEGQSPSQVWPDPNRVRNAYAQSVAYSMTSLVDFAATSRDRGLVVVLLGDHQPASVVSGSGAGQDVPITVLTRDPQLRQRISAWGWDSGLRPSPGAPVWPMQDFRDRFFAVASSPTSR